MDYDFIEYSTMLENNYFFMNAESKQKIRKLTFEINVEHNFSESKHDI